MKKRYTKAKLLHSMTTEHISTQTRCYYNSNTDTITICNGFSKSNYNGGTKTNKTCSNWLGLRAEILLMNIFDHVEQMPYGNRGYDFLCGNDYKIDVKSSCEGMRWHRWSFNINHNKIADYFLCLAFDSREELNPLHLWLIPGNIVNNLFVIKISKSKLSEWSKYEKSLDDVLTCCDIMKGK